MDFYPFVKAEGEKSQACTTFLKQSNHFNSWIYLLTKSIN